MGNQNTKARLLGAVDVQSAGIVFGQFTVEVIPDAAPIRAAIASLERAAQISPEIVKRFLEGLDNGAQLCRIDRSDALAVRAGELRITLQPSELFRNFLAATLAVDFDGLATEV
ncbi:hypothetical protein [Janthinobacterium sp.]|uniref:hypothetical protein n=1 Tax=Janthinobacterium sp. TaxID=1871054 RepID=UPI00293D836C|nr:hypothetical protein [Janthinobacterium sp.]